MNFKSMQKYKIKYEQREQIFKNKNYLCCVKKEARR
jgi:hypothetical protein